MAKLMMTLRWKDEAAPTLASVASKYGISTDDLDERFGVVEIDPRERLYTILIEAEAAGRIDPRYRDDLEGPFSNPRIEPMR